MGAQLVSLALARWSHVSDRAFRVLVRMALTALDDPNNGAPAGVYFGGLELLALAMRRQQGGTMETAMRTAKRGVAELVEAGVIERLNVARSGNNGAYQLRLQAPQRMDVTPTPHRKRATRPQERDTSSPPAKPAGPFEDELPNDLQRDTSSPPQRDTSSPESGTTGVPPRNQEEPLEELSEEPRDVALRTGVTVPRARGSNQNPISLDVVDQDPAPSEGGAHSPAAAPAVKCAEHPFMPGGVREDGLPACVFCRRKAPEAAPLAAALARPTKPGRCPRHPEQPAKTCAHCAGEALGGGFDAPSARPPLRLVPARKAA